MLSKLRAHLSYANVMASIAVFIALGGGAYAAVTAPKNSVVSRSIKDGQVKRVDLAPKAVTNSRIGPNAVTTSKILDGSVTTSKIGDAQVTLSKLAPNSVNGLTNIEDGTITGADVLENTLKFGCTSQNIQAPNTGPYVVGTDGFCAFVVRPGSPNPSSFTWSAAAAACNNVVGDSTLANPAQIEELGVSNGGAQSPLAGTSGIWTPDPAGTSPSSSAWTVSVDGSGHVSLFTAATISTASSGPVACVYQPASKNG